MSDKCIHLPVDFASRTEFRIIEAQVKDRTRAAGLVALLFSQLAYSAAAGQKIGFLPQVQADIFSEDIQRNGDVPCADGVPPAAPAPPRSATDLFCEGQMSFLVRCEGGFFCSMFARENKHLSPFFVSMQKAGGLARGIGLKRKCLEGPAAQQSLFVAKENFVKPDGSQMDVNESNRVILLIKLVDNCMARRSRNTSDFTPGLVQDALRVLEKFEEDQINQVCGWLMEQRDVKHPAVPETTEQILESFERIHAAINE